MVSIHRPLGYGPSTLPLRHAAQLLEKVIMEGMNLKIMPWTPF